MTQGASAREQGDVHERRRHPFVRHFLRALGRHDARVSTRDARDCVDRDRRRPPKTAGSDESQTTAT